MPLPAACRQVRCIDVVGAATLHRIPRWNRCCQARGRMTDDVDPQRSHDDSIDPHPALRAGLSLAGRGVFSLP